MNQKLLTKILFIMLFLVPLISISFAKNFSISKLILLSFFSIILLLILITIFRKQKKIRYDKVDLLLIAFILLLFLSTVFSLNVITSIFGAYNRHEGIIAFLIYFLIYYIAKHYAVYNHQLLKLLLFQVVIISLTTILKSYEIAFFNSGWFHQNGNLNFFGSYITIFLSILTYAYLLTKNKLYYILTNLFFASMICSLTRSSWLAFGIILIFIFIAIKKNIKLLYPFFILICSFSLIFIIIYKTNYFLDLKLFNSLSNTKDIMSDGLKEEHGSYRIRFWRLSYEVLKKHPLLGCGVDALEFGIKDQFEPIVRESGNRSFDKAHNEYLHIAATIGIPALIIYLIFLFLNLKESIKQINNNKLNIILLLPVIGYLIQAFFNISVISVAPFFWLLLGLNNNKNFKEDLTNQIKLNDRKNSKLKFELIVLSLLILFASVLFLTFKNKKVSFEKYIQDLEITLSTVGLIRTGPDPKEALEYTLDLASKLGFKKIKNMDNKVGYIEFGEGEEIISIFVHLDVAPIQEGWTIPPFEGVIKDNKIYGRGTIDDRGPTMAVLYAMKSVMDSQIKLTKKVRLIMTTDEETSSESFIYYLQNEEKPDKGFIADAQFPVVASLNSPKCTWSVDETNEVYQTLLKVYNDFMKTNAKPITVNNYCTGIYLDNIIPFGPIFPDEKIMDHEIDEFIDIKKLELATKIYAQAIYELAK